MNASFRIPYDGKQFSSACALLRLSTKYGVQSLRKEIIAQLSLAWPTTLNQWESREKAATDLSGTYSPRSTLPHPVYVALLQVIIYVYLFVLLFQHANRTRSGCRCNRTTPFRAV